MVKCQEPDMFPVATCKLFTTVCDILSKMPVPLQVVLLVRCDPFHVEGYFSHEHVAHVEWTVQAVFTSASHPNSL